MPDQTTVLLIDDEPMILLLAEKILGGANCRAILADCGKNGLQILHQRAEEIDLVIIDYSIGDISGFELLKAIRSVSNCIPAIISSGELIDPDDIPADLRPNTSILQKPYRSSDLIEGVETAIASSLLSR